MGVRFQYVNREEGSNAHTIRCSSKLVAVLHGLLWRKQACRREASDRIVRFDSTSSMAPPRYGRLANCRMHRAHHRVLVSGDGRMGRSVGRHYDGIRMPLASQSRTSDRKNDTGFDKFGAGRCGNALIRRRPFPTAWISGWRSNAEGRWPRSIPYISANGAPNSVGMASAALLKKTVGERCFLCYDQNIIHVAKHAPDSCSQSGHWGVF